MRQHSYLKRKVAQSGTEKSKYKLSEAVSFSALVLTLTTALLYFLGSTYYLGYLSYWGLPEELFSLSREKSVMSGIFAYALICARELLQPLANLVFVAAALAIIALLCSIRYIKDFLINQFCRLFRLISPLLVRHVDMGDAHEKIINRFIIGMLIVALPLLVALAILKTAQWADNQGREVGKSEYKRILSGAGNNKLFSSRAVLYLKDDTKSFDLYSGHLINTSATHCAVYNQASGIMIFPLANVSRMVIRENKNISSTGASKPRK